MSLAHSVYVRLPNWVGDVCMCLPALHLLRQTGHPLVFCARPWARDLLAGLKPAGFVELGKTFSANRLALRESAEDHHGARGLVFTNSLSSAALFRLAGIAAAGYRGDGRSLLLRWAFPKPRGAHEVEVFYQLALAALQHWQPGLPLSPAPDARLALPLTQAHHDAADRALARAGIGGPFVLLAPIATGLHHGRPKAWPLFGELARSLASLGVACVICPPAHEIGQTQDAAPTATLLAPLALGEFAALLLRAAAVVCNDSGTSHVAAAVGARQITLFGVTHRERTGPWSPQAVCLGTNGQWPDLPEVLDAVCRLLADASA